MNKKALLISLFIIFDACLVIGWLHFRSNGDKPASGTNSATHIVSFSGQVTRVIDQGGETCLTYEIDNTKNVAVTCPDMNGQRGFIGLYDRNLVVGEQVNVRADLKISRPDHSTYHIDQKDTYVKRVR